MLTTEFKRAVTEALEKEKEVIISIIEHETFPIASGDNFNYRITMSDFTEWREKVVALIRKRRSRSQG